MEATKENKIRIVIILEEYEAKWLKDYLQNYIGVEKEQEEDQDLRYLFFNTIKEALNLPNN